MCVSVLQGPLPSGKHTHAETCWHADIICLVIRLFINFRLLSKATYTLEYWSHIEYVTRGYVGRYLLKVKQTQVDLSSIVSWFKFEYNVCSDLICIELCTNYTWIYNAILWTLVIFNSPSNISLQIVCASGLYFVQQCILSADGIANFLQFTSVVMTTRYDSLN